VPRKYHLGRRQAAVDGTRAAILAAARDELASGVPGLSAGAVARRAGVSRLTIYNRFGSKAGLLRELAAGSRPVPARLAAEQSDPLDQLRQRVADSCTSWSADPALFRNLRAVGSEQVGASNGDRELAERLAASGRLRPGCSLKEAEDLIGAITSFEMFDRLYKDGRRSTGAVTEILLRLASTILQPAYASASAAEVGRGLPGHDFATRDSQRFS
jgi:AcrR family transcriptional regulator